jgi:CheY-like chemotaxis protein
MSKRILVVDDSPYVADAFARLISHCGYETRTVYGGREAIRQTAAFMPDMVLMDIGMPDPDGYEAARQIRSEPQNAHILLVAVTCLAQLADKQRALESGFHIHVPKPVGLSTLYGLLAKLHHHPAARHTASVLPLAPPSSTCAPARAIVEQPNNPQSAVIAENTPKCRTDRPLTIAQFEKLLDGILASHLPDDEQRKAVEDLFTKYAATLPNY